MGVGEGDNEMPEHLLEQLRKRPIYYKSEIPKDIPVKKTYVYFDFERITHVYGDRLANIPFIMADFALGKIL